MALFGSLFGGNNTNPNTMSLKEDKKKKKKGKDNEELAYDNPAFQILSYAISGDSDCRHQRCDSSYKLIIRIRPPFHTVSIYSNSILS